MKYQFLKLLKDDKELASKMGAKTVEELKSKIKNELKKLF